MIGEVSKRHCEVFSLYCKLRQRRSIREISSILSLHAGTLKRWEGKKQVPKNYLNDLNILLGNGDLNCGIRDLDQFFTKRETAAHCVSQVYRVLDKLGIDTKDYHFIEPSAGDGTFYDLLPTPKTGVDLLPTRDEFVACSYLEYKPYTDKNIVIGNPPFGLRGNLALRFINHSFSFADVVCFILPPLFNSDGKGVPKKRVKGYYLVHTEPLKKSSFIRANGEEIDIHTVFQVWTKINTSLAKKAVKTCDSYIKVYSLSDGGTPSTTRNKKMIPHCDVYLPSTCFRGMQAYSSFEELPNKRGYGVVFLREKDALRALFFSQINWEKIGFFSTNSAINLRSSIIKEQITKEGFVD